MKRNPTVPYPKDRIDLLVDELDKYYFRLGTVTNVLSGSEYIRRADIFPTVRKLFETPRNKEAAKLFYDNLEMVEDKELQGCIELAALGWLTEDDFPMLLGFVLGLRIAGIDSERTKAMARTWRLGLPQDDPAEEKKS